MAQITNGSARFLKRVKTGDYEHKEASTDISFAVGEGEDHAAVLAQASALAVQHTHEMLGLAVPAVAQTAPPVAKRGAKLPPAGETKAAAPDTTATAADPLAMGDEPAKPAVVVEGYTGEVTTDPKAEAVKAADPLAMGEPDIFTPLPTVVTDKDLGDAVSKKNESLITAYKAANKDPALGAVSIRTLIGQFVTPPKRIADIGADQRHLFLERLQALKAE